MPRIICFFIWMGLFSRLDAQPAGLSTLSIPQIMQGESFVGYLPESVRWSADSETIYFTWNPQGDTLRHTYQMLFEGGDPERVPLDELRYLPAGGDYTEARDELVYAKSGDLFLLDVATGRRQRLTHTTDRESNPVFSADERYVLYERDDNLYAWERSSGAMRQLTNFRQGKERSEPSPPTHRQWLEEQQQELFQVLRERETVSELRGALNDSLDLKQARTVYIENKRLSGLQASPDLRFITCRLTTSADQKNTEVPYWVDGSGYVNTREARAKVGEAQNTYQLGVYDTERDTFYTIAPEQLPGVYDKPAFLRDYHEGSAPYEEQYDEPREVIFHGPYYSDDGKAAVVARSLDNKDRWIALLELADGTLQVLDRQRDEAWIGGPGIGGWNFSAGAIGWLADQQRLFFQSEATGYSHLYTIDVTTRKKEALTTGDWEVREALLSHDKQVFYIIANRENPYEQHFYHLPVEGGELIRLTDAPGKYEVDLSPDERHLAIRFSSSNQPWELYTMDNRPGAELRQRTESTSAAFQSYAWRVPRIVRFKADDGALVSARLYRQEGTPADGPAVIFVHGAGYLQNVHRWWSSYYREYMFHNFLVDHGYTVLDIDYRGSDGYGRDWRTGIYRHMGGKDLSDQVDGARFLVEEYGINPDLIGIYGGSYGGFITLMAMFTAPETFASGAALRSVTDWAHYNHGYTSNILNTPVEDSLAYRRSSPIHYAEGLQGRLLILHGMVDTNVQFQDVVRLAQRLIELEKDDWEFAVFPVEGHGFREPSSWTDEYKRIYQLFQETLR